MRGDSRTTASSTEFRESCSHNYSFQNAEPAKVDFDKVLIDSASTTSLIKIEGNRRNGLRWLVEKRLLYKIHINGAESEDLD
jgi:hypothetical protein